MAERNSNGRHYLSAIFWKAWEEFGFIELLSEAIGGFTLACLAWYKGWINEDGAFEIALECIGCAILIPLVAFILRAIFTAPAELLKESEEAKKKVEINPK